MYIFSRRFMKWNATIIVTFFFYPHELTKIVLQKFYKILLHQNALFGLANWTKMVLPVFPRNIPNRARPKSPPFQFFSALRDIFFGIFFSKFFSPKGPPAFFWCFATEWMLKNLKGSPLSVFFGIVRFFSRKWKKIFSSIFSCFATEWMLKNLKGPPPFSFSALWDFSAPVGPFF